MSLNKKEQRELSDLLNSILFDAVTEFPISNASDIPFEYIGYEVVLVTNNKTFGFSIVDAIKESKHTSTVVILDKSGMHYYYTDNKHKQPIWMPDVQNTINGINGTVVVLQEFPSNNKCSTKFIKAKDITDKSIEEYLDKDAVIFGKANFYISKSILGHLAEVCNDLWSKEKLSNFSPLPTLQTYN